MPQFECLLCITLRSVNRTSLVSLLYSGSSGHLLYRYRLCNWAVRFTPFTTAPYVCLTLKTPFSFVAPNCNAYKPLVTSRKRQVASHCIWHPIFVQETALLTIGRTTGKLSYIPCYLTECQSVSQGWHAVQDLNPRRRRFVASRTLRTVLTAYIKLIDKIFSSDRYRYRTGTCAPAVFSFVPTPKQSPRSTFRPPGPPPHFAVKRAWNVPKRYLIPGYYSTLGERSFSLVPISHSYFVSTKDKPEHFHQLLAAVPDFT